MHSEQIMKEIGTLYVVLERVAQKEMQSGDE